MNRLKVETIGSTHVTTHFYEKEPRTVYLFRTKETNQKMGVVILGSMIKDYF